MVRSAVLRANGKVVPVGRGPTERVATPHRHEAVQVDLQGRVGIVRRYHLRQYAAGVIVLPIRIPRPRRDRSRGQSLVEFALVAPILIILLLIAVDFGRIYLGYINLQQMARIAASYAAEHASDFENNDVTVLTAYRDRVEQDSRFNNCNLEGGVTAPAFTGYDLGDQVEVRLTCTFPVITPIISTILGGEIPVGARVIYPVREGVVASVPGGGSPPNIAPVADFVGSPSTGYAELEVTFTDISQNDPTSWVWNFGDGTNAFTQGPHTRTYDCTGTPGDTCTYTVSLQVGNDGGFDTETRTNYVVVTVPPADGPIAEFTATPTSGTRPLSVSFEFVDLRLGAINYTRFEWDFDGDGTFDRSGPDAAVSHTYAASGIYDVTLRVSDDSVPPVTAELTKVGLIVVNDAPCVVPDFQNRNVSTAQALWAANGFTTTVNTLPPSNPQQPDYKIRYQSLTGGLVNPPGGCGANITVGPRVNP